MLKFFAGVLVTLAVLYPAVTKELLGTAVDTTHDALTTVIEQAR